MEVTIKEHTCETCKHVMRKHQRYCTYDNRMLDFYELGCLKGENIHYSSTKAHTCGEWEETASS